MPAAGLHVGHAVAQHRGPDGDRRIDVTGEVQVADHAAVEPAPRDPRARR